MSYFVTGATGFIGRNLVEQLLEREGTIYVLVREGSRGRLEELRSRWGADEDRVVPVIGDLSQSTLGCEDIGSRAEGRDRPLLPPRGDLRHDRRRRDPAGRQRRGHPPRMRARGGGRGRRFHMVSSIAAAGLYKGASPRTCSRRPRRSTTIPTSRPSTSRRRWCARKATCPGASTARDRRWPLGDRRDGQDRRPLLLLQAAAARAQPAAPVGARDRHRGRQINIVPVDFVAEAMDHIAHLDGLDGRAFHLTDPNPMTAGAGDQRLRQAAHAPEAAMRIDSRMFEFVPKQVRTGLTMLPPVKRISDAVLADLGIPRSVLVYINYPTRLRLAQDPGGARGDRHLSAAARLRGQALGLLGAQPRPRPVQDRSLLQGDRRQW